MKHQEGPATTQELKLLLSGEKSATEATITLELDYRDTVKLWLTEAETEQVVAILADRFGSTEEV